MQKGGRPCANVRIIAFIMSVFAGLAVAQVPTSGNVFFGYSYYNTDLSSIDRANTNGWQASLEGRVLPFVGIIADFDSHYGSQNFPEGNVPVPCPSIGCPVSFNADVTEHNFLSPQLSAVDSTIA